MFISKFSQAFQTCWMGNLKKKNDNDKFLHFSQFNWNSFETLCQKWLTIVSQKAQFFAVHLPLKLFAASLSLLMLTLEVKSLSIYYLISIWTTCWWNLNKIIWAKLHEILISWQKTGLFKPILTSVDAILKDVSVAETIV